MKTINVSYSAIDTYTRCPRKYKLSYIDGLTRAQYEATPASLGSAIHAGLAFGLNWFHNTVYDGSKGNLQSLSQALSAFFEAWAEANAPDAGYTVTPDGSLVEDTTARNDFHIMTNNAFLITVRTLDHLDVPNNWRTVELDGQPLIEYNNTIELTHQEGNDFGASEVSASLTFQVDWVARDLHSGLTYVVDWKSRKTFQPDEYEQAIGGEDFNFQISLYAAAMQQLGVPINGTITYQIAPYVPEWPAIIKNGRISKANIRSDWDTYRAAIMANNEDPEDEYYAEMREKLNKQVWWSPVTIYRGEAELRNRWEAAGRWAVKMWDDAEYLPVESIMCRLCPFAKLCIGYDRELDVDSIRQMEYTTKTAKETGVVFDAD